MEEVVGILVLFGIVVGGWVLGIVGFSRAGRALREVAALRATVARMAATDGTTAPMEARPIGGAPDGPTRPPLFSPWRPPADTDTTPSTPAGPLGSTDRDAGDTRSPAGSVPPAGAIGHTGAASTDGAGATGSAVSSLGTVTASAAVPPSGESPPPDGPPPDGPDGAPSPGPDATPPAPTKPQRSLEDLLTARWGVWAGAVALLMSGVFLIRYAVEQSLLGPGVRCLLGFLLGGALIAGGEWALRRRDMNEQVPPALAAGGVAILFGAAFGAGVLYELVPPLFAFVLLAGVSFAGMALSLRFGPLVAAIGVAGGYVTPALVDTGNPSLPGLFVYLLFVLAAALAIVRYTAWIWLGWTSTIAGAVWVLLGLAAGRPHDMWAPALFVPAATALNLFLLPPAALNHLIGRRLAWVPCAGLGFAGLLVALAHQGWDTRAGVLLLAPLMVWTAWREPRLRLLPFLAALLFLLLLAGWSVRVTDWPDITTSPDRWRPAAVGDLLATAAVMAGFFAASGLALWSRAPFPLPWASLTATVPVLALAITYTRVTLFETRFDWAVAAFLLAAGLVGTTAWTMKTSRQVAGTQAAGAAAAIALGCAMVLSDQWLTVAIALLLPALAWIEAETDLRPLRLVARAIATIVLVRLLLNWHVAYYAYGTTPIVNGLLAAYGVPAACFALAAWLFRRRGDDATVAVLQAGSAAFATVLVALEIRHIFGHGDLVGSDPGFGEWALHVCSLAVMALVTRRIARRIGGAVAPADAPTDEAAADMPASPLNSPPDASQGQSVVDDQSGGIAGSTDSNPGEEPGVRGDGNSPEGASTPAAAAEPVTDRSSRREPLVLGYSWRIQGGLALLGAMLLLLNTPAITDDFIGHWPLLNWLLFAYLVPAALAVYSERTMTDAPRGLRRGLSAYALVALFVWVTLEIRHWFQGDRIGLDRGVEGAELWAWSGAWLIFGAALMIPGLRRDERALRLAGIGITMLATVKVFLVDMNELDGLWRVLSFLGLGLALIGLGAVYQRLAKSGAQTSEPQPVQQGQRAGTGGNG